MPFTYRPETAGVSTLCRKIFFKFGNRQVYGLGNGLMACPFHATDLPGRESLKNMKPDIKVVCAHPIRGHYIQGLKNMEEAIVPEIYDPSQIDVQEMIESEEAIAMARRIIAEEGIFAGMSSGAAMLAAVRTAGKIDKGNIVVVFPDRAEKYLSTSMFAEFGD